MTVTDYYDSQSLLWLGSSTTIHNYVDGNPSIFVNDTFTRQLVDVNYQGRPPGAGSTDNSNPSGYNIWTDPMLWVAVGVVAAVVVGIGITIYFIRKRSRLWELAEIEKFQAKASETSQSSGSPNST
jgi:hypothetical protein